ncbi:hypothetical protein EOD41_19340 [Mucilaginibacter limnophilus]|uniref:META domain-containing protein n=1 Tax=Mucilaginibacter limnophilus TaxID=1932778 RepID=A0A3S2ULN5_9SPHI|nr:hypothetical protein [Mucilaginibacter limnophilus]RVT97164.1 hypothetical protein EOD41_19340 [Mucilaginibacter limnophilus]
MKKHIINILIVATLLSGITLSGCIKDNDTLALATPGPITGTFEGPFKVLKKRATNNGYDTLVNDTLELTLMANNAFTVDGDTTNHAGSKGAFKNENFIQFNDRTYTDKSLKKHLHGLYNYFYDGQKLQITRSFADGVGVIYDLRKK